MYLLGVTSDNLSNWVNRVQTQLNHVLTQGSKLDASGDWDQQANWSNRGIPLRVRDDKVGSDTLSLKEEETVEKGQAAEALAPAKRKSTGGEPAPNRPSPPPQTPVLPTMRTYPVTYQHGTPTTSTHRPPSTALAQHTRVSQAPHTLPLACARHQPPSPHDAVRPQVPPTASHRMSSLRSPAATTDSPALQPRPLGLPRSRAPPHPLPPLRGPQPPPPHAARGPSRTPPHQPPQLLRVPHRHPPGPPGRVLRGGRGGPRMDHSRGHGQHTPAPPRPTPTPQRRRLERGGPPHPPRPIPPPP